jgi:hypothetical protein
MLLDKIFSEVADVYHIDVRLIYLLALVSLQIIYVVQFINMTRKCINTSTTVIA